MDVQNRIDTRTFASLELRGMTGEGRFAGYASLFGEVDLGKDTIERGAFRRSLETRGPAGVRMLFQHDPSEPLGHWQTIREDARGLYVEGVLATGVARAREVHQLMKNGALDGLSIGFQTVKARNDARSGIRRILEADLWEISIVTFPMLPGARVADVKTMAGRRPGVAPATGLPTKREFERWLTRDAGLTRGEARTLIARGFNAMAGLQEAAAGTNDALVARIRQATQMINKARQQIQP